MIFRTYPTNNNLLHSCVSIVIKTIKKISLLYMLRSSQMRTTYMTFYFSLYNSIRKGSQKDSNSLLRLPVRTVVHPAISHCPGGPRIFSSGFSSFPLILWANHSGKRKLGKKSREQLSGYNSFLAQKKLGRNKNKFNVNLLNCFGEEDNQMSRNAIHISFL